MRNKKGFTLIELLAVIVILAVIALIVTPIVTGIISNARDSANARSVEGHVQNINYAIIQKSLAEGVEMTAYDTTNGPVADTDLATNPYNLSWATTDTIKCAAVTIKDGVVAAATGCTNNGWTKTYNYAVGTNAVVSETN